MSPSDDTQNTQKSSSNISSRSEADIFMGLSFGLVRNPSRGEYVSIAKYIAMLLTSSAVFKSQTLHELLNSDLSKIVKYIALGLIVLTVFLFYKMLEKNGLLKKKYARVADNTYDDN